MLQSSLLIIKHQIKVLTRSAVAAAVAAAVAPAAGPAAAADQHDMRALTDNAVI